MMVITSHIDEQSMFILYCSYGITQNIKASVNYVEKKEMIYSVINDNVKGFCST